MCKMEDDLKYLATSKTTSMLIKWETTSIEGKWKMTSIFLKCPEMVLKCQPDQDI